MKDLSGKTALITGGSRGVGYATAANLASRGANVVITARSAERLESSRRKLEASGAPVVAVAGDVGHWPDAERMVNAAVERFGGLDILVNNAGVSMRGRFAELAPETCDLVLRTNLLGAVYPTRAAVAHIVAAKGHIIFVSSIAGIFGLPGASVYCASKGALTELAGSLRLELGPAGVHVGVVHLGFTEHDPEKRLIAADGSALLPDRPAHQTQAAAAARIVVAIDRRQRQVTLTPIGKLGRAAHSLSPRLVEWTIGRAMSSNWKMFQQYS